MRSAAHLSIESMCRLGQVSRAGFYRHWKQHEPRVEQAELRARMHQIVLTHRRNYGYRRVTQELRNQGWAVNHKPGPHGQVFVRGVETGGAADGRGQPAVPAQAQLRSHHRLRPRSARLGKPGQPHAADRQNPPPLPRPTSACNNNSRSPRKSQRAAQRDFSRCSPQGVTPAFEARPEQGEFAFFPLSGMAHCRAEGDSGGDHQRRA